VTAVSVSGAVLASIRSAAVTAYPDECCGFLLSPEEGAGPTAERRVIAASPSENRAPEGRRRRFVIPASELRSAEENASRDGRVVSGFYHSHPDHPAQPSEFDRDHAWPWYTYLVVSVLGGRAVEPVGAFELDPDRREFFEVPLSVQPDAVVAVRSG
jgi:proteasome lid subunit RPN8/RPN11